MFHPDMTMKLWERFVRQATKEPRHRGGIVAIEDRRRYIHAVFAYRLTEDMAHGLLLRLTDLVMGRLPGGVLPRAVISYAEGLATDLGSSTIAIDASVEGISLDDYREIQGSGFRIGAVVLLRTSPMVAAV
ncbi:hypothetical protein [Terrarubrum flagellatum]|uniref:hypothetical protein n=1 Tax=Terrirubrum flagellatum TaxID=2895980 RepID=UPI003144F769